MKISVDEQMNSDYKIRFDVHDTGIGIPKDKISQLFQAFSQVDSSTSRKYGGTGLGLAICTRLVELMQGEISVSSTDGKGSVFSFTIQTEAGKNIPESIDYLSDYQGCNVLVVDDNQTSGSVLKRQLEQWGLNPIVANSGKEALDLFAKNAIALVITDMEMPEMNGIKLAKAIKKQTEKIPVILLSFVGDEAKKKHPELLSAVLTKPAKQLHLCKAIHTALGGNKTEQKDKAKKSVSDDFAKNYPMRILVAEDNKINQKFIEFILKKLGYEIDMVHNGIEVLKHMETNTYDVVLMDVQMPEMDGFEATNFIKSKPGSHPVIVAMTANALFEDKELYIENGMDDYLAKPMKIEEVMDLLSKIYKQFIA